MRPLPYWKQVGSGRWVFPRSEYALEWCPVNCHLVLRKGGKPLFQCLTLAEATEALRDLVSCSD